jgi:hypothetical protein
VYGKFFEGLNYAGAALSFAAGLGALAVFTGLVANLWLLLAVMVIYTVGQFFILVSAVGLTGMRFTPKNVAVLFVLHSLLSWWDLITVLLILPFIPVTMILGPFMTLLLALAGAALGMYLVEVVLGYDVQGYSSVLSNAPQAGGALVIFVCASLVLWQHTGRGDDWVLDRATDWIVALRRRLQGVIEGIVQE